MIKRTIRRLGVVDLFVGSGLLTIFAIRGFLATAGYPVVGNESLHIAHMLWGGLMLCGVTLYLLLAKSPNKIAATLLAGVGFGLFIDELGKFITRDNDYFFKPAIMLIYLIFLIIWLGTRPIIARSSNVRFIPRASWPKHGMARALLISCMLVQLAVAVIFFVVLVRGDFDQTFGHLGVSRWMLFLYALFCMVIVSASYALVKRQDDSAAKILLIATIFSIICIYPIIFYIHQFVGYFALVVGLAVVITTTHKRDD